MAVIMLAAFAARAAGPRLFDLMEFQVEGNTLLPPRDVESVLYPFLGPDRPLDDVEKARAALEDLFGRRGFPTVSAMLPPQDGANGVVRIVVIERPVGRLRVVGSNYVAPSAIKSGLPSLTPGKVPFMPAVQSELVAVNQLPGRSVAPSLHSGVDPNTVDVDLKVDDHLPVSGSLELNNRRSQQTTALRTTGSLTYNNLWQRGDSVSLGFQAAPQRLDDAKVGTFSYTYRIPDSRASLTASYVQSDSAVSAGASGNVVGRGKIAGLSVLVPFDGEDGFTHSATLGFNYKDLTEDVGAGASVSHSPVTYWPFTAGYLASWTGNSSSTDAGASAIWTFGRPGSDVQVFDNKRAFSQPGFAYLKADFTHTHTLPYSLEVYGHAQMQMAGSPLVSSEQFSVGGMDTVRGYLESESLGDYGGSAQLELRSPPLGHFIGGAVTSLRVFGFADAGADAIRQPLPGQTASDKLASVGVGASVRLFDHIGGEIDDAQILLHGPASRNGANRVLFRLNGDF